MSQDTRLENAMSCHLFVILLRNCSREPERGPGAAACDSAVNAVKFSLLVDNII